MPIWDDAAAQCVCRYAAAAMPVLGSWEKRGHPAGAWYRGSPSPTQGVQAGTPAAARLPRPPRSPGCGGGALAPTQAPTHQEHSARSNKIC